MTTFIKPTCPRCGTKLERYDDVFETRHKDPTEYVCPQCTNQVYQDTPWFVEAMKGAAKEWEFARGRGEQA